MSSEGHTHPLEPNHADPEEIRRQIADGRLSPEAGLERCLAALQASAQRQFAAEEAGRRREQRYQTLFHGGQDLVFVTQRATTDEPMRFIEVNDRACQVLGYSREELLGMSPADLDAPEDAARIPERTATLRRDGQVLFESVHIARDGRHVPVEITIQAVELGEQIVNIAIAREIGARKRSERALAHQQAIIRTTLDLTSSFLADPDLPRAAEEALRALEGLTGSQFGLVGARYAGSQVRILACSASAFEQAADPPAAAQKAARLRRQGHLEFPWFADLMAGAMEDGQPTIIEDFESHALSSSTGGSPPIQRLMGAPLSVRGVPQGVVLLANKATPYDQDDLQALQTLASRLSQFIEHDRLQHTLARRARFAEALQQAGVRLARAESLVELEEVARQAVTEQLGYALGSLVRRDQDGVLAHMGSAGSSAPCGPSPFTQHHDCASCEPMVRALDTMSVQIVPDLSRPQSNIHCLDALLACGLHSLMVLPVALGEHERGALVVAADQPWAFPPELVPLLETYAGHFAQAWANLRLRDQLRAARDLAEASSRTRAAILTNITHQLRTPLTAVIGFANVLTGGTHGSLNDRQLRFVDNIRSSGEHQLALVNAVIDIADQASDRRGSHPDPAQIAPVVERAAQAVRARWAEARLDLEIRIQGDLPLAPVSPTALQRALEALLTNAFMFTPDGGRVSVSARAVLRGIELVVADSGCGIATEDHERIFEPFEQATPGFARRQGGAGLGLPLARFLVTSMGGRIQIDSEPGQGCRATITIPRADGASRPAAPVESTP